MSAFDARVRIAEASVNVIKEEGQEFATEAELVLGIATVVQVGPNQILPIPFGAIRVPLDKSSLDSLRDRLDAASKELKERVDIAIAPNLNGVENLANMGKEFRGQ